MTHQTVQRCLARAAKFGCMAALDDSPRPGKEPEITVEARAWLVSLACQKAKDVGYPHELWTTRLLARHAREHGPAAGHACLARIAQGTVCKILADQEVKPHKVRYYLERRDPAFEAKMAEVLCVYQEVAVLRAEETTAPKPTPDLIRRPARTAGATERPNRTSQSSPMMKSRASRRSPTRPRTCHRWRASMPASRATMNTSATGH